METIEKSWQVADRIDHVATAFGATWIAAGWSAVIDAEDALRVLQREIDKPRESQASNTREALQALIFGILAMMGRIEEARALQEETNLEVAMLHIEIVWQEPKAAAFLRRLAEFSRLILFDKRGTGMSDTVSHAPPVDERMDDIGAVMDAAGSRQAALLGYSEGGALALVFAASHPERITGVIAYASFARPARAVECGRAIQGANQAIGLHVGLGVRVGLHVGECELRGDDIGGMAVHTAARVADAAAPDEILVSSTVKDLVAGSGLGFIERGRHQLRGVPGEWRLFAVSSP